MYFRVNTNIFSYIYIFQCKNLFYISISFNFIFSWHWFAAHSHTNSKGILVAVKQSKSRIRTWMKNWATTMLQHSKLLYCLNVSHSLLLVLLMLFLLVTSLPKGRVSGLLITRLRCVAVYLQRNSTFHYIIWGISSIRRRPVWFDFSQT